MDAIQKANAKNSCNFSNSTNELEPDLEALLHPGLIDLMKNQGILQTSAAQSKAPLSNEVGQNKSSREWLSPSHSVTNDALDLSTSGNLQTDDTKDHTMQHNKTTQDKTQKFDGEEAKPSCSWSPKLDGHVSSPTKSTTLQSTVPTGTNCFFPPLSTKLFPLQFVSTFPFQFMQFNSCRNSICFPNKHFFKSKHLQSQLRILLNFLPFFLQYLHFFFHR